MTKNTLGGKKNKSFARKTSSHTQMMLSSSSLEVYAIVTKIFGNGLFQATTNEGMILTGHIRNKFKGRSKHSNLISNGSIILLGLREWESTPKNADLIYVYDASELETVQSSHNIQSLIHIFNGMSSFQSSSASVQNDILFTTHDNEDEILSSVNVKTQAPIQESHAEDIDVDDI